MYGWIIKEKNQVKKHLYKTNVRVTSKIINIKKDNIFILLILFIIINLNTFQQFIKQLLLQIPKS